MKKEITVDNIKIEVLSHGETARYLGQKITFEEEEIEETKNRLKIAWAAFPKYHQELTTKDYRLCHRLRLFSMVITPTLTYASGTWTLSQKHERIIKNAQRKMLRLIVLRKRKYKLTQKRNTRWDSGGDEKYEEEKKCATDKETEEGSDQNSDKDQDSDVSFQEEIDEEIDTTEKEEDWIEYIKISTKEAEEHVEKHKIPCWIEIHRRLKWRMTRRIVSLPDKRWTMRVFDWPGLDNSIRTRRQVGRPKRRWEDDFNEFLKTDETQAKTKYDLMNNNSWMMEAKKYKEWKEKEEKFVEIWKHLLDRKPQPWPE